MRRDASGQESIPQGLKPAFFRTSSAKAKALAYLEARAYKAEVRANEVAVERLSEVEALGEVKTA